MKSLSLLGLLLASCSLQDQCKSALVARLDRIAKVEPDAVPIPPEMVTAFCQTKTGEIDCNEITEANKVTCLVVYIFEHYLEVAESTK